MADHLNILEEGNGDGDAILSIPELEYSETAAENATNHVAIAINNNTHNNEMIRRNLVDDGNGENSQLDPEHAIPTSGLRPGNIVEDQNGQYSQLDPGHAKPRYGIYKLLKMYAVSQAGILAAGSSARRRAGWSLFILSGLVSISIIVVLLLKLSQQLKQLRKEEYCRWVAEKAAIVVMLMALSPCLLFTFIP